MWRLTDGPPSRCSCLCVPASSARKLEKAAALAVDEVVIDLEDAVAVEAKESARAAAVTTLETWSGPQVAVRVNAPRSEWCHRDLLALGGLAQARSVVLPKVQGPGDIAFLDRLLDGIEAAAGRAQPLRVQALIETASGLAAVQEIASASPRLEALVLGYADLGAALGGDRDLDGWLPAQHAVLLAARAHGLQAIDGPCLGIHVDDDFLAAARKARQLGFDGKWAIHPTQLATLNDLFSPTEPELEWARRVIDTLTQAERESGQGATLLDGEMLDEAVRVAAMRVLARAEVDGLDRGTTRPDR